MIVTDPRSSESPTNEYDPVGVLNGRTPSPTTPEGPELALWPDVTFELSEQNIFGRNLPTSPEARLRSALRSLQVAEPRLEFEVPVAPLKFCKKNESRTKILLDRSVNLGWGTYRVPRFHHRDVLGYDDIMGEYTTDYQARNHPVSQLVATIDRDNQQRRAHNQANRVQTVRLLSDNELTTLRNQLIFIVEGEGLMDRLKDELAIRVSELAGVMLLHHTMHPDGEQLSRLPD